VTVRPSYASHTLQVNFEPLWTRSASLVSCFLLLVGRRWAALHRCPWGGAAWAGTLGGTAYPEIPPGDSRGLPGELTPGTVSKRPVLRSSSSDGLSASSTPFVERFFASAVRLTAKGSHQCVAEQVGPGAISRAPGTRGTPTPWTTRVPNSGPAPTLTGVARPPGRRRSSMTRCKFSKSTLYMLTFIQ